MMASACVNSAGVSPEIILDTPPACPSYGWLSPRISFSRDSAEGGPTTAVGRAEPREKPDLGASAKDLADFEFRLDDPVAMLPADELFSGGKLVPLQLAPALPPADEILSSERPEAHRADSTSPSPRAPRCSSRWRVLLGLRRKQQHVTKPEQQKVSAPADSKNPNPRSLKKFLRRDPRSIDPSLSLPLLRESDSESVSLSSRQSLSSSSSSSGQDHEELPRLSLETDKPGQIPISLSRNSHPPRVRVSRPRSATSERRPATRTSRSPVRRAPPDAAAAPRGASVDSPRMNASGRVVFERSSSSPGSFNGGPRVRPYGMERSYSAGVRVAPVLNVPVFGLGQLFRKEREGPLAARGGAAAGSIKNKIEKRQLGNEKNGKNVKKVL